MARDYHSPAYSYTSDIGWKLDGIFVLIGIAILLRALLYTRLHPRKIRLTDTTMTIPKNVWTNKMVTLRGDEVRKIDVKYDEPNWRVRIKYDGGRTKLHSSSFDSDKKFEECMSYIESMAKHAMPDFGPPPPPLEYDRLYDGFSGLYDRYDGRDQPRA